MRVQTPPELVEKRRISCMVWRFFFVVCPHWFGTSWQLRVGPALSTQHPWAILGTQKFPVIRSLPQKKPVGCLGWYFRLLTIGLILFFNTNWILSTWIHWVLFVNIFLWEMGVDLKRGGPWNPKWRFPQTKNGDPIPMSWIGKNAWKQHGVKGSRIYFATGVHSRFWSYCI